MLVDRKMIQAVFIANGFTIKEGQTDLKEYVYKAAEELLALQMQKLDALSDEMIDLIFQAANKDMRTVRQVIAQVREGLK